jgi:hypothetical protein
MQVECNKSLESSQQDIQVCFRPHPNRRSEQRVIACKVAGVQIGIVSGLLLGNPGIKSHSDVGAAERHKEYNMGEGGGFP